MRTGRGHAGTASGRDARLAHRAWLRGLAAGRWRRQASRSSRP